MELASHESIPLYASIPFFVMLMMIAVGPLTFHHWWEENKNKLIVSLALGIPTAIYLIFNGYFHNLEHQIVFDYIPFIILLGGLFIITGGINLSGDIEAKPSTNLVFLGIGAVLASLMGTTGAAMLLIRPVINTNSERKFKVHTILFFIAIVANAGGLLTPLGDPPLFLLYLRGAPFGWFIHLLPEWLFTNAILLLVFYITDKYYYLKEPPENIAFDKTNIHPIKLRGTFNFIFLAGVVFSVAFLNKQYIPAIEHNHYLGFIREAVIMIMAGLSLYFTSTRLRQANKFTYGPILEVAYLFLGIFITMVPALLWLEANAKSLGVETVAQFYYATGALSSFLDNAPTAVSFYNLALGLTTAGTEGLVAGIPEHLLKAISVGSVFFGAMTYIGNGPNFMVKAIAEENKINMPGFFGYMFKFSLIVLLPIYILVQVIFL
ncbi:MAG: sodium:proton antiporter [Bacteroidetes bacterium HGW-Bacteroidetes-11]|jgi:Na+/H+ antiporter NhaD/arsenite permease-like protein|nr:MAG: sodium:proton antiporter [Bacteroidetes bacterium HGW-Bacteroidetes-11]